jgi:hypothetical protein
MTMRPIKAWALVIRNARGEWSHVSFVHRTQREVRANYISACGKFGVKRWRKRIADGSMRLARVTITEDTP